MKAYFNKVVWMLTVPYFFLQGQKQEAIMLNSCLYCCYGQETFNEKPKLGFSKGLNSKGDSNYYMCLWTTLQ